MNKNKSVLFGKEIRVYRYLPKRQRRMRTRLFIPLLSSFVPRTYWTYWTYLCVSCLHKSQAVKLFPGKENTATALNSLLYAFVKEGKVAFVRVRADCRWSKAFLVMKCSLHWAVQLETTLPVLFVGPGSTWWRRNNCAVRSREQALTYIR